MGKDVGKSFYYSVCFYIGIECVFGFGEDIFVYVVFSFGKFDVDNFDVFWWKWN